MCAGVESCPFGLEKVWMTAGILFQRIDVNDALSPKTMSDGRKSVCGSRYRWIEFKILICLVCHLQVLPYAYNAKDDVTDIDSRQPMLIWYNTGQHLCLPQRAIWNCEQNNWVFQKGNISYHIMKLIPLRGYWKHDGVQGSLQRHFRTKGMKSRYYELLQMC